MKYIYMVTVLFLYPSIALAGDEYVTVDPASIDTIDGKTLMIASYAIVLGMLLCYWIYMSVKTKKLDAQQTAFQKNN